MDKNHKGRYVLIAVVFLIIGMMIPFVLNGLWEKSFARKVRLIQDVDYEKYHYSSLDKDFLRYHPEAGIPDFKGYIKSGSIGTQTFIKGGSVYIDFQVHIPVSYIEYIKGDEKKN